MSLNKLSELKNWFEDKNNTLIATSGGVDSALVAYAAFSKLGSKRCMAITADYKTLSNDELESAKRICLEIGIPHKIISYNELENDKFVINDKNRCFHCRTELGQHLQDFAKKNSFETIVDGTHVDDLGDYRPGITALRKYAIKSPLVETNFTKNDIRNITKDLKLSVYDRPSNSCLASRIPWGNRVTAEKLARIEMGEIFVKQIVGAKQVRVRDMDDRAKVEIGRDELYLLECNDESKNNNPRNKITEKLKMIGFSSVEFDSDGYAPGKVNVLT